MNDKIVKQNLGQPISPSAVQISPFMQLQGDKKMKANFLYGINFL